MEMDPCVAMVVSPQDRQQRNGATDQAAGRAADTSAFVLASAKHTRLFAEKAEN
jgi:hypothetical protein